MATIKFINKRLHWLFTLLCFNLISCNDSTFVDEYINLQHTGEKNVQITELPLDTIYIDASLTSLEGEWHLKDNKLYFIDKVLIGVNIFNLNGQYIGRQIERGRGPNEILQPMLASSFSKDGDFVGIDQGWVVSLFNEQFKKEKSYRLFEDIDGDKQVWEDLLQHPNPNEFRMYEFFINTPGIRFWKDQIIIPIITEHIDYNGFYKNANAQDFWLKSYNFLTIDIQNRKTKKLFGHYPPIFRERNIPVFSLLYFDIENENIYCSYRADSLIYIRNNKGELVKSIGYAASSINGNYPDTETFEDYSKHRREHEKQYGFYKQIKVVNKYLFRSYKKDGELGYGLQIYKNDNLIGDINFVEEVNMIGYSDGFYYGVLPVDIDSELFRIIKFKL